MNKVIVALAAATSVLLGAGAASAQNFGGTTGTITGQMALRQTLPFDLACSIANIPVSVSSTSLAVTTSGATLTSPVPLCFFPASAVTLGADWQITPAAAVGGVQRVNIYIPRVNALGGYCGAGTIYAEVVFAGPDLELHIPRQSIPGMAGSPSASTPCYLEGDVVVSNVSYS